jgi:hypothetical protein
MTELRPLAEGNVMRDLDMKYENLVKGVRHLTLTVLVTFYYLYFYMNSF